MPAFRGNFVPLKMIKNGGAFLFLLLVCARCAPISSQPHGFFPRFNWFRNPAPPPRIPPFPWPWFDQLPPPPAGASTESSLPDQTCASIYNTESCVEQIPNSFFSDRISISSACCNAINLVDQECIIEILRPLDPLFAPVILQYCLPSKSKEGAL